MLIKEIKKAGPETYFFYLMVLINLRPALSANLFPTLDGPAHLYNSNLIFSFLSGQAEALSRFYVFDPQFEPNWTGHVILTFFNSFLPGYLAEKIVILTYVIGLPLAYRSFIQSLHPPSMLISYFIFPFCYNFLFMLGFYNFSLAVVGLFLSLAYWLKNEEQASSVKFKVLFCMLLTFTYFSHIFVFVVLMMLLALRLTFKTIVKLKQGHGLKQILSPCINLLMSAALPLGFSAWYFLTLVPGDKIVYVETKELLNWLVQIRPLIVYYPDTELPYTTTLFWLIIFLIAFAAFRKLRTRTFSLKEILTSSAWLCIGVCFVFVLYLNMPDGDGSAGFVSVRLALLLFLLLLACLAYVQFPKIVGLATIAVLLWCTLNLQAYDSSCIQSLNTIAADCVKAGEKAKPNRVVIPINCSDNWLTYHFSNYLGIDKPLVILENYEASLTYFHMHWKGKTIPDMRLGNLPSDSFTCQNAWMSNRDNPPQTGDYVFVLGNLDARTDSCHMLLKQTIASHYEQVFESETCKLYKTKEK